MKKLLLNVPGLAALAIVIGFSVDLPFLRSLKTEQTFGVWVVILVPGAVLFVIAQLILWLAYPTSRPWRRRSGPPDGR